MFPHETYHLFYPHSMWRPWNQYEKQGQHNSPPKFPAFGACGRQDSCKSHGEALEVGQRVMIYCTGWGSPGFELKTSERGKTMSTYNFFPSSSSGTGDLLRQKNLETELKKKGQFHVSPEIALGTQLGSKETVLTCPNHFRCPWAHGIPWDQGFLRGTRHAPRRCRKELRSSAWVRPPTPCAFLNAWDLHQIKKGYDWGYLVCV